MEVSGLLRDGWDQRRTENVKAGESNERREFFAES